MPFVAEHRETRARIDVTRVKNPRLEIDQEQCICPLCGAQFTLRVGLIRRAHFAHRNTECRTQYRFHPESAAHLEAKLFLLDHLREEFPEYSEATIELEVKLEPIWRVADVLVTFPSGWRQAHEIQLSSITVEELRERTNDYTAMGIDVVWWLGRDADHEDQRKWCIETFGYSLSLQLAV
jgi:competence protein CoiA